MRAMRSISPLPTRVFQAGQSGNYAEFARIMTTENVLDMNEETMEQAMEEEDGGIGLVRRALLLRAKYRIQQEKMHCPRLSLVLQ